MEYSDSNFESMTVPNIRKWCKDNSISPPSKLKKSELIEYIKGVIYEKSNSILSTNLNTTNILDTIYPVYPNVDMDVFEHLDKYGWAVFKIPGWKDEYVDRFYDWMEFCCSNFRRNDRSTWLKKNMVQNLHGIFKQYIGHIELLWEIRELCAPIFADLYGLEVTDLLCSFDGGCFMAPQKSSKNESWIHNDTPRGHSPTYYSGNYPKYRHLDTYQGIVNFLDNGPNDGGLLLVENSHLIFDDYMRDRPSYGLSWGPADMSYYKFNDLRLIKICAPPGHIILFHGKIFHANVPPGILPVSLRDSQGEFSNIPPTSTNPRMCTYVSMQPKCYANSTEITKRTKWYEEGRMTGHWCYGKYLDATAKDTRIYNCNTPRIVPQNIEIAPLNQLRSSLVGY